MLIDYYLPESILENKELEDLFPQYRGGKIYEKTGIKKRHISASDEFISDMSVAAAEKLFAKNSDLKHKIDFLILCTQTPDYAIPTTACLVQQQLGLSTDTGALDVNLGCSGFVYCLALAKGLLAAGLATDILLIMAEAYTKHIHPLDGSTRTIFGDGASAIYMDRTDLDRIGQFCFGTDGKGKENLIIPASGVHYGEYKDQTELYGNESGKRTMSNLYMNGLEVYDFTLDRVPELFSKVLEKNHMCPEDLDWVIPHQANRYLLGDLCESLSLPADKMYVNLEEIGNTVSASIPIAIKMGMDDKKICQGDKLMLLGFGVGYSWAGTIINFC